MLSGGAEGGAGARYFWSVRKLWRLFCQYQAGDLKAAVAKAHEHRLFDVNRIETILLQDAAQKLSAAPGFRGARLSGQPAVPAGSRDPGAGPEGLYSRSRRRRRR